MVMRTVMVQVSFRLFFWTFGAVFAAALLSVLDSLAVQSSTNDVVTHPGKILHTASAHQYDGVFLKVVSFTWNVGVHFKSVRQSHTGVFTKSGVWFLWCHGGHFGADSTLEWAGQRVAFALEGVEDRLHGRRLALAHFLLTTFADQLIDGGHA